MYFHSQTTDLHCFNIFTVMDRVDGMHWGGGGGGGGGDTIFAFMPLEYSHHNRASISFSREKGTGRIEIEPLRL